MPFEKLDIIPDFIALIDRVKDDKIEITITIEPDRTEITMHPWKPYRMACPYANVKEDNDD